ncbi:MAG: hypothetical protein MHMPM18_005075 [Marteilia pararefringens]
MLIEIEKQRLYTSTSTLTPKNGQKENTDKEIFNYHEKTAKTFRAYHSLFADALSQIK